MVVPLSSSLESLYLQCYNHSCMLKSNLLSVVVQINRRLKCGATGDLILLADSVVRSSHLGDRGIIPLF